jgi:hypothetical protein
MTNPHNHSSAGTAQPVSKLSPCPFDNGSSVDVFRGWNDVEPDKRTFYVMCRHCESRGPWCDTEEQAVAQWNGRAAPPQTGQDALGYATRLLEHFVAEHFPHNPDWKPLPDLIGVLTQIDNVITNRARLQREIAGL